MDASGSSYVENSDELWSGIPLYNPYDTPRKHNPLYNTFEGVKTRAPMTAKHIRTLREMPLLLLLAAYQKWEVQLLAAK